MTIISSRVASDWALTIVGNTAAPDNARQTAVVRALGLKVEDLPAGFPKVEFFMWVLALFQTNVLFGTRFKLLPQYLDSPL